MSAEKTEFLTSVGRLVSGDCFKANTTDMNGNPMLIKSGPNIGQPTQSYSFGVAFPKTDPGYAELWAILHGVAKVGFPQYFDAAGACILPTFSFKVTDGDSTIPNTKNIKPCDREGYPGNWIIFFSGAFAPKCYTSGGAAVITDPNAIKKGYFVRVSGSTLSNQNDQKPGIYVNHSMVEMIAYGDEIFSGPDGAAVFGGAPVAALPAGASTAPLAPATTPAAAAATPGVAPPVPAAAATPGVAPPVPAAAVTPGVAPPVPAQDYLNADPSYNVNGQVFTKSALIQAGHPEALIATYPLA